MPFTEEEKELIRNYQYKGADLSFIYQNVLTHWSTWCVETFVPTFVAPNVLTLLGLLVSFSATVITVIINPTLEPGTPRWVGLMVGLAIFTYQTLDAMDGKQARKTKSSSALGMVFDHGCDAINGGVSVLAMGAIFGTGWTGKLLIGYFGAFAPFYVQTWEEYYTGCMIFPAFNGPTQGLLMAIAVCFLQAYTGNEYFHQELFQLPSYLLLPENIVTREMGYPSLQNPSVTPFTIIVVLVTICLIPTFLIHPYRVIKHQTEKNEDYIVPLLYLLPFLLIVVSGFYYSVFSSVALKQFPLVTAIFYCVMFAEINIYIMTSHIAHRPLKMFQRIPLWILVVLALIVYSEHPLLLHYEAAFLFIGTILCVAILASEISVICAEYCEVLNIHVFLLGKAKQE